MVSTKGNLALKNPWGDDLRDTFEVIEGGAQKAAGKTTKVGAEIAKSTLKVVGSELINPLGKAAIDNVVFLFDPYSKKDKTAHEQQPQPQEKPEKKPLATAPIDYAGEILHAGERFRKRQEQSLEVKIEEIKLELKKLIASSKEMQVQFKNVSVEQTPKEVGVYHEAFFDWLLSLVHQIRMRVEDSSSWMQAMNSKSAKKQGYWGMFKKHGTMFGMSGERSVATQVG